MASGDVPSVTLEVTVAPVDLPHATHILPHQLRQWAAHVDDIQFTLDGHQSPGRFGEAADERRRGLQTLLEDLCRAYPHAHVREVDYSPAMVAEVAARFLGGRPPPPKDHRGGPIYSYLFGWHVARHDLVLHVDSDMLFGGGSRTWVREAVGLLQDREDVLLCSPFPGPPPPGGALPPEALARHAAAGATPRREPLDSPAYSFTGASTRLLLFDRRRFVTRLAPLRLQRPRMASAARAILEGHRPYELPEVTITRAMQAHGLRRVDFLGSAPGMWSLHPPLRSHHFHRELPRLVERVERGDVPDAQRGDFDVNDSMIDWSSARAALRGQRWWRRLPRHWAGSVGAAVRGGPRRG